MKIKNIVQQYRRDFTAIYVCENCETEKKSGGYDDRNFHVNVIPKFKCEKCGESQESLGIQSETRATRYPEGFQV